MRRNSKRNKGNCSTCVHAFIDEQWGDYKCKLRKHRIYDVTKYADCKDYKKVTNQSQSNE